MDDNDFAAPPVPQQATTTTMNPTILELLRRMEAGPEEQQAIVEHHVQLVALTVAELKQAVASNPSHALAADFAKACMKLTDSQQINVEQPTLAALIHNRPLITRKEVINGRPIQTKHVG